MRCNICGGKYVEKRITYTIEIDNKFILVENVPAKVCSQCGEELFSPDTVEKLQKTVWSKIKPRRIIQTPVYNFVA